ncbi:MAG: hypothetical protein HY344_00645 [Candidatus Levybacteria bacterium]|nr:hypothetical protein [Candidatus Levybacteria bacterium]
MKNKAILGALSMDLKRVALGYHRGSNLMAERFFEEALKRRDEIDLTDLKPYLLKCLKKIENIKNQQNDKAADDALLYSTIFQNAAV